MKLLAFSDLHCDLDKACKLVDMSGSADVVIGAGDFASAHSGLLQTIDALKPITKPVLLVAGNNETESALRETCEDWPNATVLHGQATNIEGVEFFGLGGGIPLTPWDWSFDLTEEEAEMALSGCPSGGVLIVHSPPKGFLDLRAGTNFGSEAILKIIEAKQPQVAVFGHVHECWAQEATLGPTRLFNLGPEGRTIEI